jgi:hypothetical protein
VFKNNTKAPRAMIPPGNPKRLPGWTRQHWTVTVPRSLAWDFVPILEGFVFPCLQKLAWVKRSKFRCKALLRVLDHLSDLVSLPRGYRKLKYELVSLVRK